MSKINNAKQILKDLGLPKAQQNDMAALTLLALCNIKKSDKWENALSTSMGVSKGIMAFIAKNYKKQFAANTRETFRRHVLHQFVQARIVDYNPDDPSLPINSPKTHYALTKEFLKTVRTFGSNNWETTSKQFVLSIGTLTDEYFKVRALTQIPVKLANGQTIKLSAGEHNKLQAGIIELFAPRFVQSGILLYLGDTAKKDLYREDEILLKLGIPINQHSKLPDVIILDTKRNWLYLIEAVTSHGPISPKRIKELNVLLHKCNAGRVFVTAFPNTAEFKKYASEIAWETEVWLMDKPDHMIHFNGDRFLGPR